MYHKLYVAHTWAWQRIPIITHQDQFWETNNKHFNVISNLDPEELIHTMMNKP